MGSPFLGELMGTMVLILLGNGVVAGVLLKQSKAQDAGWVAITAGWALAVMSGVFVATACGSPDAHLNPAVTLGFAIISGSYAKLATYVPAQMLGAMLGATLVWLHYLPHWRVTPEPELKLACFSTSPAFPNRVTAALSEAIATFVLVLVAWAIFAKSASAPVAGLGPWLVGSLVWGIGLSLGGPTGYAINPARDLGPRIMHAILPIPDKGPSHWGYAPVPILGPLLGAALAALLVNGLHL